MGLSVSLAPSPPSAAATDNANKVEDNENNNNHQNQDIPLSQKKRTRLDKVQRAAAWKQKCDAFCDTCLTPNLVQRPVRAKTMESAAEYPQTTTLLDNDATLLPGPHKHLGGAYDPSDGCIYGVPASSKSVLVLYPTLKPQQQTTTDSSNHNQHVDPKLLKLDITSSLDQINPSDVTYRVTSIPLPKSVAHISFKWLRGIFCNGYLYAIPAWAPAVLCVDVDAFWGRRALAEGKEIVTLIPLPKEHTHQQWQWHGAGMNHEQTAIYCVPSNAHSVLKVDLTTQSCSLLPIEVDTAKYPDFDVSSVTNKWYGGIVGRDNCVYAIPYRAPGVLRIDCPTDTASVVGPNYGVAQYNWHGGILRHGKIYAHPSHANYTVLVIDTNVVVDGGADEAASADSPPKPGPRIYELPITRHEDDTCKRSHYKWLGGSVGADGNIYCPACDVTACLKIDVTTDTCTTFGHAGDAKNKWQGGVLGRDGCVYCIPASGRHVLRIATFDNDRDHNNTPMQLLGNLPAHKDKWQGGHVGLDGALYLIPENGYRVLKIVTPLSPPELDADGQLPNDDVTLEML